MQKCLLWSSGFFRPALNYILASLVYIKLLLDLGARLNLATHMYRRIPPHTQTSPSPDSQTGIIFLTSITTSQLLTRGKCTSQNDLLAKRTCNERTGTQTFFYPPFPRQPHHQGPINPVGQISSSVPESSAVICSPGAAIYYQLYLSGFNGCDSEGETVGVHLAWASLCFHIHKVLVSRPSECCVISSLLCHGYERKRKRGSAIILTSRALCFTISASPTRVTPAHQFLYISPRFQTAAWPQRRRVTVKTVWLGHQ